jgi:hypothetical protein
MLRKFSVGYGLDRKKRKSMAEVKDEAHARMSIFNIQQKGSLSGEVINYMFSMGNTDNVI